MTVFVLAPLFSAVANFALALFIFFRAPRHRLNQVYLGWGMALTLWCVGAYELFVIKTEQVAIAWARLLHLGVIWIPATGLHVCMLMAGVDQERRNRRFLIVCYAVTIGLVLADIFNVYINGVEKVAHGWFSRAGPGFHVFSVFMPCATIPAVWTLFRRRQQVDAGEKRKFSILIAANSLLLLAGAHDIAPVLGWARYPGTNIPVFPWGTFAAGLYGLMVGYGVLQDQILDVRVTLSRYVAYTVRVGFFCSVAFLLLILVGLFAPTGAITGLAIVADFAVIVASALLTGWLFPKLFGGAGAGIERRLLGDRFEYQEQIVALADSVHRYTDLKTMWQEVADTLHAGMKVSPVHCLLLGPRSMSIPLRATTPLGDPTTAILAAMETDSAILAVLRSREKPFDVNSPSTWRLSVMEHAAQTEAQKLEAEYVFALKGADRLLGFMAVGKKSGRAPITAFDIELLERLAQRVAWATERTLLAQQAAFAERHELLAMMSRGLAHDLNNLLTPVSTILQITGRTNPPGSPEAQLLEAAETSLRSVRNYVEEAIFFAKDLRPRMTEVSIDEIISEAKLPVDNRAQRKGVTVQLKGSPERFTADCVLCQRMLANLLSNAIDASHGGQTVGLAGEVDFPKGVVRFTVTDSGVGIPPENLAKVWQPYFTTKDSDDDGERGFGLGLAVCQLLVELHQGVITLQSTVGVGTTVTIELPRDGAGQPVWLPPHFAS